MRLIRADRAAARVRRGFRVFEPPEMRSVQPASATSICASGGTLTDPAEFDR